MLKKIFILLFYFFSLLNLFAVNSNRMGVLVTDIDPPCNHERIIDVLDSIKEIGATWMRTAIMWSASNPERDLFDLSHYDFLVNEAKKRGIEILFIVAITPKWASSKPNSNEFYFYPPTESVIGDYHSPLGTRGTGYDYFYRFVYKISKRYRYWVNHWELWNEPDMEGFLKDSNGNGTTSDEYAKMLAYFYRGIKDGNPEAKVLLGGLADSQDEPECEKDYLLKILTDNMYPAYNNFDIHNIHTNFKSKEEIFNSIKRNKMVFSQLGFTPKEIWITETSYSPVERFQRVEEYRGGEKGFCRYIQDVMNFELNLCSGKVFWASLFDEWKDVSENDPYKHDGLFTYNMKLKEGGKYFKRVSEKSVNSKVVPIFSGQNVLKVLNNSPQKRFFQMEKFHKGDFVGSSLYEIGPLEELDLDFEGSKVDLLISTLSDTSLSFSLKSPYGGLQFGEEFFRNWIYPGMLNFSGNVSLKMSNPYGFGVKFKCKAYSQGKVISIFEDEIGPHLFYSINLFEKLSIIFQRTDYVELFFDKPMPSPILVFEDENILKMFPNKFNEPDMEKTSFLERNFLLFPYPDGEWDEVSFIFLNPSSKRKRILVHLNGDIKEYFVGGNSSLDFYPKESIREIEVQNGVLVFQYLKKGESSILVEIKPRWHKKYFFAYDGENYIYFFNPHSIDLNLSLLFYGSNGVFYEKEVLLSENDFTKLSIENIKNEDLKKILILSEYSIPPPITYKNRKFKKTIPFKLRRYPLLMSYFLPTYIDDSDVLPLAKRDLVILDMENQRISPDCLKDIKRLNGDSFLLSYMTSEEIETDSGELERSYLRRNLYDMIDSNWWLSDCNGEHIVFWPGTFMLNCSNLCPVVNNMTWGDIFSYFVSTYILSSGLWDGFYVDNCWDNVSWVANCIDIDLDGIPDGEEKIDVAWHQGMENILSSIRKRSPGFLIMGNGGYTYGEYLNGALIEEFTMWDNWFNEMETYLNMVDTHRYPFIGGINGVGEENDYRKMRFFLTSTLMGDGFFSYDNGAQYHNTNWWYDEFDCDLGEPAGKPVLVLNPPELEEDFENLSWNMDENIAHIKLSGLNGKSIIGDSLNSFYEWNEFLSSPVGNFRTGEELIVEFDYEILERGKDTDFYYIFRSKSDQEPFLLDRGNFFGKEANLGEYKSYRKCITLGDASDYYLIFGIRNKGKIIIDDVKIYGDRKVLMYREFERGLAICNNSNGEIFVDLGKNYKKILGTQDPLVNSGEIVNSVVLSPHDGIILLKINSKNMERKLKFLQNRNKTSRYIK